MNVQIPVKWLQELLALCGPEDHELRERVMVSITAMDEQAAAPAELNLDDYYCKGCGRIGEIEELSAQDKAKLRKIEGKPKTVAAPVLLLPEPVAVIENGSLKWKIPTGEYSIDVELIRGLHNLYTEQQVRELLAKDLDTVNLDRLGKALTKLGHATWVSQEEAAAEIPRWVNALTSCVLEIPEAAPKPQADALDTERLNWLIEQGCSNGVVYGSVFGDFWMVWLDGNDVRKDKHQAYRYPTARDAIDAAIAAEKEHK